MKTAIIIPARYGSTRFPGKPLAKIKGRELLLWVYESAMETAQTIPNVTVLVATEDHRIERFCVQHDLNCVMTSETCESGTDRAMEALHNSHLKPDFIVNLQGDLIAPPHFINALIETYKTDKKADIVTPVVQLDWTALDALRQAKITTPFSGTTVAIDTDQYALWFSKNIIPAIRKEEKLRDLNPHSPIFRHIGMYGYSLEGLKKYVALPHAHYEQLEGLEQLRALENGMKIKCVAVEYGQFPAFPGIDSPEDLARAEKLLAK